MGDPLSAMLDLAIELHTKEATGQQLAPHERIIVDITWLDTQIAPNGFQGWLCYTSCECMLRTLTALNTIGCSQVAVVVEKALLITAIDPTTMPDEDREARLEQLSEADARRLFALDNDFYDAVEDCMERLRRFVRAVEAGDPRTIA